MWFPAKLSILTIGVIMIAFIHVGCGVAAPTPAVDVAVQNPTPTPTATATPTPTPSVDTHRAAVSFGENTPINDADLLALLVKHNVKGLWAHTEVYEYSGSSQAAEPTDPQTFVSTIREEIIGSFAPALTDYSITMHARALSEEHSLQDLATSEKAKAELTELVRFNLATARAQEYVNNGGAVVYSVIVVGKENDLRRLGAEERVQGFNIATIDKPWFIWPPFPTPTPTPTPSGVGGQADPATPTPTPLPPQELYDRVLALAAREVPGQPPFYTPTPTSTPTPTAAPAPPPDPVSGQ